MTYREDSGSHQVSQLALAAARLGGIGLLPGPTGTYGAFCGLLLAVGLEYLLPLEPRVVLVVALNVLGVPICHMAAQRIGQKDPSQIIWDEFASVLLVFCWLPVGLARNPWIWLAGFALHRLLDISKPPPVAQCEALPGGWGIMLDDVVAAILAMVLLRWCVAFILT